MNALSAFQVLYRNERNLRSDARTPEKLTILFWKFAALYTHLAKTERGLAAHLLQVLEFEAKPLATRIEETAEKRDLSRLREAISLKENIRTAAGAFQCSVAQTTLQQALRMISATNYSPL